MPPLSIAHNTTIRLEARLVKSMPLWLTTSLLSCQIERSRRRIKASQSSLKARDKQVTKFLQSKILEQVYGGGGTGEDPPPVAPVAVALSDTPDMYQLPPLPENTLTR